MTKIVLNESYVDPTSKYYIDRMWEEYHKVKNDLAAVRIDASSAWQEYHKMKEELADTKSRLGQAENYINETLKPELADAKIKLKMAQSAWDELDKSHAARAKLHDELVIAEGQRDQWKMRAEKAAKRDNVLLEEIARCESQYAIAVTAERDALLTVYEAAEVFVDMPRLVTESALRDAVTTFRALAVQPSTDTWEDTRARCS